MTRRDVPEGVRQLARQGLQRSGGIVVVVGEVALVGVAPPSSVRRAELMRDRSINRESDCRESSPRRRVVIVVGSSPLSRSYSPRKEEKESRV